jgi:hypothetical protein
MEHPPDNNSGTSPKTRTEMVANPVVPIVGTTYSACPQYFCLPRSVANVCTPKSLGFLSHADNHWSCVFNYMSHLVSQNLHSFIQITIQNCAASIGKMWLFLLTSPGLLVIPTRPQNVLSTSDNKQWTAGDSGLPGIKAPGFHPGHYPDQLNPVPTMGLL